VRPAARARPRNARSSVASVGPIDRGVARWPDPTQCDPRHTVCLLPRWDGLYGRGKPLSDYFAHLPRHVAWTCDPSGKNERLELKKAGFNVREGINAKPFGINLVTRRGRPWNPVQHVLNRAATRA
jgi:hypothetical protein